MAEHTTTITLSLQNEVLNKVDGFLQNNKDVYSSRSHMINCAIIRELRRLGSWPKEETQII